MIDLTPIDRRAERRADRRRNSLSGRRTRDPHARRWRRAAWLFALYAVYLSVRSLPSAIRRLWRQEPV